MVKLTYAQKGLLCDLVIHGRATARQRSSIFAALERKRLLLDGRPTAAGIALASEIASKEVV